MTELLPVTKPTPKLPHRHAASTRNRSTRLDREIDQLRLHLQHSYLPSEPTPTLSEMVAALENISFAMLDISRLFHTYQILKSAGEPMAEYLEQSLLSLVQDLEGIDQLPVV